MRRVTAIDSRRGDGLPHAAAQDGGSSAASIPRGGPRSPTKRRRSGSANTPRLRTALWSPTATLFLSMGLSDTEAARALGRTVPPSVAAALGVTAARDRRSLLEVSRAVPGQSDEAQDAVMFASADYPPAWAFRVPRPGRQQLEAALAVAEVGEAGA